MSKADQDQLKSLWYALRDTMMKQLENDDEPNASFLNVVRQFLRDNGVTQDTIGDPLAMREALEKLTADLPTYDDESWNH